MMGARALALLSCGGSRDAAVLSWPVLLVQNRSSVMCTPRNFRHYDHHLYIQNQIRYGAKNPSLMNHHVCLLIPNDWLKVRP